ncbi:MAG: phage tail tape measure protein [Alphaproteobacteria bacterium]|uniref:Putative tail protein n=1 Tax=viral metagenome TaxID=1070528 RepID=A0A6H1ZU02_9ZZZZ|nr:phage tail tape measure protein [Alphaproteobacteria bacterium]MBU0803151.1 phage tail tape measure protein [Alphaproteobacteria bacterium]MBU0873839.1 phage tail tape measure protein [Alphaproteobacteria bacterium]MBU1400661.1 phage tail tape measure protein [Alphaproteobacteria bacterium]MBU1590534.1 phage tail tape measure protein [Alphaproteobacteria bacterium]
MVEDVTVRIDADTTAFQSALENLDRLSDRFGSQLTGALKSAAVSGRDLEDVLRRVGLNLAGLALEQGLKPLQGLAGSLFSGLLGGLPAILPFARGGVPGHVAPFAAGGVVSAPSYFPIGRNLGLMGEAGAEAILPLRRGADGRLGVAASGGGAAVNVVFNVTATDAASFRKSEAQVTGMLARAVSRGARTF